MLAYFIAIRRGWSDHLDALGNDLRDPDLSITSFGRVLKTHLFQQYSMH